MFLFIGDWTEKKEGRKGSKNGVKRKGKKKTNSSLSISKNPLLISDQQLINGK